jgi:hypothetical protein
MHEDQGVESYRLDTITRTTRFVAGVAPKVATRLSLGAVLALDDAANDPAGELLAVKITERATGIASTVRVIARASTSRAASAASSIGGAIRTGVGHLASQESLIPKVPVLGAAAAYVSQASSEIRDSWQAAGYVSVQISQEPPVEDGPANESVSPVVAIEGVQP